MADIREEDSLAGWLAALNIPTRSGRFFASPVLFVLPHSLKYLNVSANALEKIPPSSESEESLSSLQELYLTGNSLTENCGALLVGHQNLQVLHIAYNQLLSFPARCVAKPSAALFVYELYYNIYGTSGVNATPVKTVLS